MSKIRKIHYPKGPGGTWKTGQRVPTTGHWEDQYGTITWFDAHDTFNWCIARPRECAFRKLVRAARERSA